MKKLVGLGIILVSSLSLAACSSNDKTESSSSSSKAQETTVTTSSSSETASSSTSTAATTESSTVASTKTYGTAAEAETALNAGEDLTGATVTFTVDAFEPASAFGYNMMTGEHLNFVSPSNPGVKVGDTVTVKITNITSTMGSFIISYEMQ